MRTGPNDITEALNQIAAAASADLLAGRAEPYFLQEQVRRQTGAAARAALDAAVELAGVQSGVQPVDLQPLLLAGAVHPHWWVRVRAARDLYHPLETVESLLRDPSPAVAAQAAAQLADLPEGSDLCFFGTLPETRQALILAALHHVIATAPPEHTRAVGAAAARHAVLSDIAGHSTAPGPLPDWQAASAEEIAVALRMGSPSTENVEMVILRHPDPLARQAVLEWLNTHLETSGSTLPLWTYGLRDADPSVVLVALQGLQGSVAAELSAEVAPILLELTEHPCRRIVQAATGSLRHLTGATAMTGALQERLYSLSRQPDPLTRVHALYAFQGWRTPRSEPVVRRVQNRWETEPESRVRLAAAETLRWLLDRDEWLATIGVTLLSGPWRQWAWSEFDWIALRDPDAVARALPRVRSTALRRRMQSRLEQLVHENAPPQPSQRHRAA